MRRNGWGGFYVVDQAGTMAPRPFGFNSETKAEERAAELNGREEDRRGA